jgi:hypothetical protein
MPSLFVSIKNVLVGEKASCQRGAERPTSIRYIHFEGINRFCQRGK